MRRNASLALSLKIKVKKQVLMYSDGAYLMYNKRSTIRVSLPLFFGIRSGRAQQERAGDVLYYFAQGEGREI